VLEGFQNASRVPELRKRLLFTFGMLAVCRIGVAIPTPGIDSAALRLFFQDAANNFFGLVNLFSGGALDGSPSSRSASCRTSAPPSFFSC